MARHQNQRRDPQLRAPARRGAKPPLRGRKPRKPAGPVKRFLWSIILFPLRLLWAIAWRLGLAVGVVVGLAVAYVASTLPPAMDMVDGRARGSVTMLDAGGQVFAWRGDQFGGMITADTVSEHLRDAVIATEDKRFYYHPGIDPRGIASAIKINLREGRGPLSGHGGSTLTQQTAKLLCLGVPFDPEAWESEAAYERDCRRTTMWRKAKEATYALAMELRYTKDEILSIYLNRAFLGAGARGFEAAAQRYFGKSAAEVSVAESAMLAGLLVAPSRFAPTNNLKRSQDRAGVVVGLLRDQGYISNAQADFARAKPAVLSDAAAAQAGGYFADWIMSSGPEFFTRNTTEDVIIKTTLDPVLQTAAEEAMDEIFTTKVREGSKAQAAIIVMSADGAVRAMVGGLETRVTGAFNRATQARRQTGSTFKPFVYATALELGYSPFDTINDAPVTYQIPGSGPWTPSNYANAFEGEVTLTRALARSLNIPAVKVSEAVGRDLVRRVARDFGIESDLAAGPALALGASESTLLEMTGAYAGILNGGSSVTPYGLVELRLQGEADPISERQGGIGERVISEQAAQALIYMMNQVVTSGTGQRARIDGIEIAGKTGTTQAARDAWFIGFSSEYVTGVWMGYDDNTPLQGVTGSGLPADIWQATMRRVHAGGRPAPLPMVKPERPAQVIAEPAPPPASQGENLLDVLRGVLGGN